MMSQKYFLAATVAGGMVHNVPFVPLKPRGSLSHRHKRTQALGGPDLTIQVGLLTENHYVQSTQAQQHIDVPGHA